MERLGEKKYTKEKGRGRGAERGNCAPILLYICSLVTSFTHSFIYPFMYLVVQYMPSRAGNYSSDSRSSVAACPEHA